ncbi:Pyroglutamyl-peptidase 1 [Fusarium austroafricanum]|uniref:Pyroglutamyl-peptidase 1 n=1 Tax=Fusarium austroafricanum TaxID=2364996 RepID=A0A8H4KVL0_9HYPO|nr:Pyroglutamyl-peptidase 1 [Fusarium austroafricanum]
MGSQIGDPDEITVLVTGFLPFREQYPVNPSWSIANSLPSHLPPLRAKDPNSRHAAAILPSVRIVVHPEAIRVNYKAVRDLVPSFYDGTHKYDVVLHIGMAGPRPFYCIERRGHRDGYKHPDVDGEYVGREEERNRSDWPWRGLPEEIETQFNLDEILPRWQEHSLEGDLRISEDAGHYMCDFIYYSSLAELWKLQRPRKALFLHVPADASPASIEKGRELTLNLIRSIVESEIVTRNKLKETDWLRRLGQIIGSGSAIAISGDAISGKPTILSTCKPRDSDIELVLYNSLCIYQFKPSNDHNVQESHLRNLQYVHLHILRSTTKQTLDKTSWWGCGSHIQTVIDNVPEADRCSCEPRVEVGGVSYPPMAAASPN